MKEYEVSMEVHGYYRVRVKAESEEEARQTANERCSEADFGPLENIDWKTSHIIENN